MTDFDPRRISDSVRAKAEALQRQLLDKVEANLSGAVLQTRSGALKASIVADLSVEADVVVARVASRGVAYAAIQEFGGRTAPHEILPVKAQALAFAGGAGKVFARRVAHPGSVIAPHGFLGGALDALQDEILGGLKQSVLQALGSD